MSSYDYANDYDRIADYDDRDGCADGQQQLLEYEQYIHDRHQKAHALLPLPTALELARKVAEDLAAIVRDLHRLQLKRTLPRHLARSWALRVCARRRRNGRSAYPQSAHMRHGQAESLLGP